MTDDFAGLMWDHCDVNDEFRTTATLPNLHRCFRPTDPTGFSSAPLRSRILSGLTKQSHPSVFTHLKSLALTVVPFPKFDDPSLDVCFLVETVHKLKLHVCSMGTRGFSGCLLETQSPETDLPTLRGLFVVLEFTDRNGGPFNSLAIARLESTMPPPSIGKVQNLSYSGWGPTTLP